MQTKLIGKQYTKAMRLFKDDPKFGDRVKKVHPDKDPNAMFDQFGKARTMIKSELYSIDDLITSSK